MALPADPSLIHAVILCSSLAILWQVSTVIIVIIRRRLIQIMDDGIQQDCNFHLNIYWVNIVMIIYSYYYCLL